MEIQRGDRFENVTTKHSGLSVRVTRVAQGTVFFRFQKGPGAYADKREALRIGSFRTCYRVTRRAKVGR